MPKENYSAENVETGSYTAEQNIDHRIADDFESDHEMYKTVVVGDRAETLKNIQKGYRLSISINMENLNIYIGSHHLDMQIGAGISAKYLCAAYARKDRETGAIVVEDFTDWRTGMTNSFSVKKAIAKALERDLL